MKYRSILGFVGGLICTTATAQTLPSATGPADGSPSASTAPQSNDSPMEGLPESTGNSTNDANNPLTPKITFNFQNYYVPSFYRADDRQADQFLLRGLIPEKLFGLPQLFRFTLPIAETPTFPTGTDTGLGDLTLIDLFMLKGKGVEYGVGPVLVAPTATTEALGAGKWQIGAAGIAVVPQSWGIIGTLVTYQQSFAGDSHRDGVTLLTAEPLVLYNLPDGFYLRSTAIMNFDLDNATYYIPLGFGAGKVWDSDQVTVNAFIEPQYTVFHDGFSPQWQVFAGINLQFPIR